jgi:hypothetical protein
MANDRVALAKSFIEPITFVIKVTATKINENGTFLAFKGMEISSPDLPKTQFHVSQPPMGGGSLYLTLDETAAYASFKAAGIKVIGTADAKTAQPKRKYSLK